MPLQPGQMAPEFTLKDTDKKDVSLQDFKGRNVVLLFIPAAFTSVCTREFCEMRDEMGFYKNLNAEIIGISVDSLFVLNRFKQDQNYNFTLLSDFNKEVSAAYDSLYHDWLFGMKGVSKRASFVIDREGIIRHAEILENASDYPDILSIKKTLAALN
jgi:glutaredoxin-dependent peroxiredoxin